MVVLDGAAGASGCLRAIAPHGVQPHPSSLFFFQAEDGIRDIGVTGVQTCALPISLVELVRTGKVDPTKVLTKVEPMTDAIEAYKAFDKRKAGWVKVELKPAAKA